MSFSSLKKILVGQSLLIVVCMQSMNLDLTKDQLIDQTFTKIPELLSRIEGASRGIDIFDEEFQELSRRHSRIQLDVQRLDMPGRLHDLSQDVFWVNRIANELLERMGYVHQPAVCNHQANGFVSTGLQGFDLLKMTCGGVPGEDKAETVLQQQESEMRSTTPIIESHVVAIPSALEEQHQQQAAQEHKHCLHISYGIEFEQGKRPTMEDTHAHSVSQDGRFEFFAVYDGHGGQRTAQVLAFGVDNRLSPLHRIIFDLFEQRNPSAEVEIAYILKEAVSLFDQALALYAVNSGSTAIIALIDKQTSTLYIVNLGDSRAVVGNNQGCLSSFARFVDGVFSEEYFATDDHKPEKDSRTIVATGSYVVYGRLNGSLAVSRAFGDYSYKRNDAITNHMRNADIYMKKITPDDGFIVLGCDGLWDVLSNESVAQEVHAKKAAGLTAPRNAFDLEFLALSDCQQRDNVTTIVVYLDQ